MAQPRNLFVNGVPQPHAIDHENLIYPGSIGDWEKGPIVHNGGRTVEVVRITVCGDFGGCNLMLARLRQDSSNRWDITCDVDLDDGQLKHTFNFVMRYVTGHSLLYSKMHMNIAAVELENLLLVRLLPMADSRFEIRVRVSDRAFRNYVNQAHDSTAHLTQNWLNDNTMARVKKWFTEVVPTFEKCWMTDSRLQAMQVYNPMTLEEGNALDVLKSRNDNMIIVTSSQPIVINKKDLLASRRPDSSAIRYACKEQTAFVAIDPDQTLKHTRFVDLQNVGVIQQLLVRRDLLDQVDHIRSRVFCTFPSFDEFRGLLSEDARSGGNLHGGLHCQLDPADQATPTVFETYGIVQCPGEGAGKLVFFGKLYFQN